MKEFYQIHELAKLFDLCPDTLRYYEEKGLLHPVRGENRYRMYGIQDVCTLNIIRSLRELDLPTREIGAYLERRSVGETLELLDREETLDGVLCDVYRTEYTRQVQDGFRKVDAAVKQEYYIDREKQQVAMIYTDLSEVQEGSAETLRIYNYNGDITIEPLS